MGIALKILCSLFNLRAFYTDRYVLTLIRSTPLKNCDFYFKKKLIVFTI